MRNFLRFSTLLLLCLPLCLTGCATPPKNEILIGEYGALTGATATFGQSTRDGIAMATDECNKAGGLLGKQVKIYLEDNSGKPDDSAAAVTKLVDQDRVVAVLGAVASSCSLAAAPICQRGKVPMITPASTNPEVTKKGDYIFRTCFIDPFQGKVMAVFAYRNLKARHVAILRDVKNAYSVGLAQFFQDTFTKLGGTIVANESYSAGDIDFKAQLASIQAANPDAVYVPGYYTEVGLIARQARGMGLSCPLLGGDGWDSPKLAEIGGSSVNGCYFSNHYSIENKSPEVRNFVKTFRAKYHAVPDAMAALAYDAARILFAAVKQAGTTNGPALRDAIAATKGFKGVTGVISIDKDHNAVKPAVVLEMKNGLQKYVTTIQP